jgi:hypothetical protein
VDSLFAALLFTAIFTVHVQVPSWLFMRAGLMQKQFDLFLLETDACRSGYQERASANLMFAPEAPVFCPFRRGDFASPGTTRHWPYAVCSLITFRRSTHPEEGDHACDYQ